MAQNACTRNAAVASRNFAGASRGGFGRALAPRPPPPASRRVGRRGTAPEAPAAARRRRAARRSGLRREQRARLWQRRDASNLQQPIEVALDGARRRARGRHQRSWRGGSARRSATSLIASGRRARVRASGPRVDLRARGDDGRHVDGGREGGRGQRRGPALRRQEVVRARRAGRCCAKRLALRPRVAPPPRRNAVTFWSWDICTGTAPRAAPAHAHPAPQLAPPHHAPRPHPPRARRRSAPRRPSPPARTPRPNSAHAAPPRRRRHLRHLPQQAVRAVDRGAGQPRARGRRRLLDRVGLLRPRLPPRLHLALAEDALGLPALQPRVGVRQDREDRDVRQPRLESVRAAAARRRLRKR